MCHFAILVLKSEKKREGKVGTGQAGPKEKQERAKMGLNSKETKLASFFFFFFFNEGNAKNILVVLFYFLILIIFGFMIFFEFLGVFFWPVLARICFDLSRFVPVQNGLCSVRPVLGQAHSSLVRFGPKAGPAILPSLVFSIPYPKYSHK